MIMGTAEHSEFTTNLLYQGVTIGVLNTIIVIAVSIFFTVGIAMVNEIY